MSTGDELEDLLPVEEVRAMFVTLGKALRAFQLYDQNNPVYQRFVSALRDAFTDVWKEIDELTVAVQEDTFVYEGLEVYSAPSRNESLAFLVYKDGVRELTFQPGVEDELEVFLSVLQRARHARADGEDLLTLLWEADLAHLKYFYIDLLAEGVDVPDPGEPASQADLEQVLDGEMEDGEPSGESESGLTPTAELVNQEDFNPTLYALDPREMEYLRSEIAREEQRDVRMSVLAALMDRLEEPDHPDRQHEILGILETLVPIMLSRGVIRTAGILLGELSALEDRPKVLDGERRQRLTELLDRLSSGETVREIVQAVEDGSLPASAEELGGFLQHLRAGALAPLVRATEVVERSDIARVLREAVMAIAQRHLRDLTDLLGDDDPLVVAGALRLAARMKVEAVTRTLPDLVHHEDPSVRLAAIEAAVVLRASPVAGALMDALDDPEREVRIAAARALATLRYGPAGDRFKDILDSRELRSADLGERIAFFESYGSLGDAGAVPYLARILNGRSFLGRRQPAEIRACAALGLGKVDTNAARQALEEATVEEDPVVRSAVNRALRRGDDEDLA